MPGGQTEHSTRLRSPVVTRLAGGSALLAACDPLETDHELLVYDVDGACD